MGKDKNIHLKPMVKIRMFTLCTSISHILHQILRSNARKLPGAGERRWGLKCLMDMEFPIYKMKRAMEMNGGYGCLTMLMYLIIAELYT